MSYLPPLYVNDGEHVWIRWTSPEHPRRGLRCIVACAAGDHARVVNPEYGVDRWVHLDELLVPPEDPRASWKETVAAVRRAMFRAV